MGLAAEVRAASEQMPRTYKWPWILEQLGPEADELEALIADASVRPVAIFRALEQRGFDISQEAVNARCRKARRVPR